MASEIRVGGIKAKDNTASITIADSTGKVTLSGAISTDDVTEKTTGHGVEIDSVTLKDGNVVLGASKGIYFHVEASDQYLDDFETGTYTPTIETSSGSTSTWTDVSGAYTKIGNLVAAFATLRCDTVGNGSGIIECSVPFSNAALSVSGNGVEVNYGKSLAVWLNESHHEIYFKYYDWSSAVVAGRMFFLSAVYRTS